MPRKGMRSIFFKSSSPTRARARATETPRRGATFWDSLMDENITVAHSLITKWDDLITSSSICSTAFLFSSENLRQEAKDYLKAVNGLQTAMHHFIPHDSSSDKLILAQTLMQTAMKRLEMEFYHMLKVNGKYLEPESVSTHSSSLHSRASRASPSDFEDESESESRFSDDAVSEAGKVSTAAMANLKAIADCMISAGYGKECVRIYKIKRKSVVDEALYHLGVERLNFNVIQKMDCEVLETKIKTWLRAVKTAVKTVFTGERILCDAVFSASDYIRESCFSDITKDGALDLFVFPESVAKCKKTPEKMFRTLDLYEAISDLWPEIESIFSFESTSAVRSQAVNSLIKLSEAVRTMITDFEAAIQKDISKSPVPGGGVHPLTRYVMNYMAFLADYSSSLTDIVANWPLEINSPLPEVYLGSQESDSNISSPLAVRLVWLILVVLCKLDGKAELYKDVALSYLFLANNLQYVVVKVRRSNLKFLLGEEWIVNQEVKVRQYAAKYERVGWDKVFASLPENPTAEIPIPQVRNNFRRFNLSFEDTCKKHSSWIVPDSKLRDEIKISLAKRITPIYRDFYEKYGVGVLREPGTGNEPLVKFVPDDLENYLSDLFHGTSGSGSVSSHSTSSYSRHSGRSL